MKALLTGGVLSLLLLLQGALLTQAQCDGQCVRPSVCLFFILNQLDAPCLSLANPSSRPSLSRALD